MTASFPELAEWFSAVKTPVILDGEILAWDFDADRALPFTALQPRLSRKRVTPAMRAEAPVGYMAFDLLLEGDELLLDASLRLPQGSAGEVGSKCAAVHGCGTVRAMQMRHHRDCYLELRQLQMRPRTRQG